jgi:hypothetical protein
MLCAYWEGLAELGASSCSKTVKGFVLECKEEGSSELRRYSVLCGVGFLRLCACNPLKKLIKKKSWWT